MNLKRFLGKCLRGMDVVKLQAQASYAQAGEDLIVEYLFNSKNIKNPTYFEIGTNLPIWGNNTYLFYSKGSKGVCIEPDAEMCKLIKQKRPNDLVLNIGIGLTDSPQADFFLFPNEYSAWSTFSEEEATIRQKESGITPKKVLVQLKPINDIIEQYFNKIPNLLSLDVEGIDLDILKSMDFEKYRPEAICVETISFSTSNQEVKLDDTIAFMHSKDYITYADTHVNTIFCKKELF